MEEAAESSEQSSESISHSSNGHQTSVAEKLNQTTSTSTEESVSNQTVQNSDADMVPIPLNLLLKSGSLQIPTTWRVMRCRKRIL